MLLGEPEWYALVRLTIWILVCMVWSTDWILHRHIKVLKYPLFMVIACVMMYQVFLQSMGWLVDHRLDEEGGAMVLFSLIDVLIVFEVFNDALTLMLILLIATGFGIMIQQLRYPLVILGGPFLLFILQSIVVISMLHRYEPIAASVILPLWLIINFCLWYFAFIQIDSNTKLLLTQQTRANPLSPDDPREDLTHEDVPFAKRTLYRRFSIIFALYFILLLLLHTITWFALIYLDQRKFLWMRTIPVDIMQIFLIGSLAFVFRLREDNPYFILDLDNQEENNVVYEEEDIAMEPFNLPQKPFILEEEEVYHWKPDIHEKVSSDDLRE